MIEFLLFVLAIIISGSLFLGTITTLVIGRKWRWTTWLLSIFAWLVALCLIAWLWLFVDPGAPFPLSATAIIGAPLVMGTITTAVITKKWSWGIWLLSIFAWLVVLCLIARLWLFVDPGAPDPPDEAISKHLRLYRIQSEADELPFDQYDAIILARGKNATTGTSIQDVSFYKCCSSLRYSRRSVLRLVSKHIAATNNHPLPAYRIDLLLETNEFARIGCQPVRFSEAKGLTWPTLAFRTLSPTCCEFLW
ncbi:MAG: hypothetical protein IH991_12475 [Planctomycetes bacterium]|nr:hypothetical protein [Planctomycetota bacterium]